jgi:hypothetical protein
MQDGNDEQDCGDDLKCSGIHGEAGRTGERSEKLPANLTGNALFTKRGSRGHVEICLLQDFRIDFDAYINHEPF